MWIHSTPYFCEQKYLYTRIKHSWHGVFLTSGLPRYRLRHEHLPPIHPTEWPTALIWVHRMKPLNSHQRNVLLFRFLLSLLLGRRWDIMNTTFEHNYFQWCNRTISCQKVKQIGKKDTDTCEIHECYGTAFCRELTHASSHDLALPCVTDHYQ